MDSPIAVKQLKEENRSSVAFLFLEAFFGQLMNFEKERLKLTKAFYRSFLWNRFYSAFMENALVGFFSLADPSERSIRLDKQQLGKSIGGIRDAFAYKVFTNEFQHTLTLQEPGFAIENHPYLELDVLDTNRRACELYRRIGFKVFREVSVSPIIGKLLGYRKRIFMYSKRTAREPFRPFLPSEGGRPL